MMISESLSDIFAVKEIIRVEEIGPADSFGYATCRLSNGDYKSVRSPVKGMPVYKITHPAEIIRHENEANVTIKQWNKDSFEMSMNEIIQLKGSLCPSKKDLQSLPSKKTSRLRSLLVSLRSKLSR